MKIITLVLLAMLAGVAHADNCIYDEYGVCSAPTPVNCQEPACWYDEYSIPSTACLDPAGAAAAYNSCVSTSLRASGPAVVWSPAVAGSLAESVFDTSASCYTRAGASGRDGTVNCGATLDLGSLTYGIECRTPYTINSDGSATIDWEHTSCRAFAQ